MGICPFVPLVNSILGADLPRISNYVDYQKSCNKMDKSTFMFYNRLHKETKVLKDATFTYRLHPNLQGPDGQRIDRQQPTVL